MTDPKPLSLALFASLLALGCGGPHHSSVDPILQQELIEEAREEQHYEEQSEEERAAEVTAHENERRLRIAENRVFESCYDDLQHLDEATQRRRSHRWRRMSDVEMASEGVAGGMAYEADSGGSPHAEGAHHEVSNVDPHAGPTPYDEDEERLIALENRYDAFRVGHPRPEAWSSEQVTELDDLADALVAVCDGQRAAIRD